MSEHPENPRDQEPERGMWHAPSDPVPVPSAQAVAPARTMVAMPDDMPDVPQERGMWHLPAAQDTTLQPDQMIEVPAQGSGTGNTTSGTPSVLRPEDLLNEIMNQQQQRAQAVPLPEDVTPPRSRRADDETQAADSLGDDTMPDDDDEQAELPLLDDDDEDFTMSEYVALASLAQVDDVDMEDIDPADLSPAERAIFNVASQYADELPDDEPDVPQDATVTLDDTSQQQAEGESAADYARRMAQQFEQEPVTSDTDSFGAAQPVQQQQYSPQEIALAQQFAETRRQVQILRQMAQQGQISQSELQTRLQQHTILDPQDNWWMIGYETDAWYRFDNATQQWVEAEPPVPLEAASPRTETGIGEAAPDVLPGSLPYLPDDGSQEQTQYTGEYDDTRYSQAQQRYTDQYGVEDTPLPNPDQPIVDPNMTQVGSSFDATSINTGVDETLQGVSYMDQTIPSESYGQDAYQQSTIEPAQAPPSGLEDYSAAPSPTYVEAQQAERSNLLMIAGFGVLAMFMCGMLAAAGFIGFATIQYNQIVEPYRAQIAALGSTEIGFQTATILAADDTVIAELTGEQGARTIVSIEAGEVSTWFLYALLAAREPNYYENPGTNLFTAPRAYLDSLSGNTVTGEERTITQRIALSRILGRGEDDANLTLEEIFVALEISNNYSKTEILDIYVNEFFFGEQTYGVEAASQFYLDQSAAELNAAEAALLVGILDSPSDTNPVASQALAFRDIRRVLNEMIAAPCITFEHNLPEQSSQTFCVDENTRVADGSGGQSLLFRRNDDGSFGGVLSLQIAEVETRNYEARQTDILYPHFVRYVLGQLDEAYGEGAYIERGFTVRTTLIPAMANAAQRALVQGIDDLTFSNGVRTGAVLTVDPTNGAIRAMVGSPDFNDPDIQGSDNRTISYEQPGDAIKPLIYASALSGGPNGYYTPASILWDVPTQINLSDRIFTPPVNAGGHRGPVPLRYALQQTLNIPAVKAYSFVGSPTFLNTATALGVDFDPIPDDGLEPTLNVEETALGRTPTTLMDLTHAYATIASDGVRHELFAVESITENIEGEQIEVALREPLLRSEPQAALSPPVAFLMQNILSDNQARVSAIYSTPSNFPANSALVGQFVLNTPDANQNTVAAVSGANAVGQNVNPSRLWTIGFTNNLVVGVWVGTVNEDVALTGNVNRRTGAAPIWNAIMRESLAGRQPGAFENPPGVVQDRVCFLTGALAPQGSTCPQPVQEIFWQNNPPPQESAGDFVQTIGIDSWTGLIANQWCPENTIQRTYADLGDPFAINWLNDNALGNQILNILGLQVPLEQPPNNACQQNQPLPQVSIAFPQANTTLSEVVPITGQISAAELARWDLQISERNQNNFRAINSPRTDQVPVAGTVLLEWNSRTVPNGQYTLRLTAISNTGGFINRDVPIIVQNVQPTPTPQPTATATQFVPVFTPLPFDNPALPTATPE